MSNVKQKSAQCKKCGSTRVLWVQSKRTQRYYLAFATRTHSVQVGSQSCGTTGWVASPQHPHKCDEPAVGGFGVCGLCGRHHFQPLGDANVAFCASYPDAPMSEQGPAKPAPVAPSAEDAGSIEDLAQKARDTITLIEQALLRGEAPAGRDMRRLTTAILGLETLAKYATAKERAKELEL